MSAPITISDLLLRWQELRRRGEHPTIQELCAEHPSKAEELARHIKAFESMEELLGLAPQATLPEPTTAPGVPKSLAEKFRPLGYELLEVIGMGGMGVVYKANQIKLQRTVALKMIAGFRAGPKQMARFCVEVEAVARLQHPHIVQIHEVGEVDGHSFFAMEYVQGGTLAQRLAEGPLSPVAAAELLETLARAIHHAHTRGIIHRDLKPANILLVKDEGGRMKDESKPKTAPEAGFPSSFILHPSSFEPMVSDFGVAKQLDAAIDHTATGEIIGTPSYMAPEQAEGKTDAIGPASDVYALGAILYEALTGKPPFQAKTVLETLRCVISDEHSSLRRLLPEIPRDLEAICLKCLEKNPKHRYPTAEALAEDLRRFRVGLPVTARPLSTVSRGLKWVRRRPVWAAVILLAAMAPAAVAGWHYFEREAQQRRVIERAIEIAPQAREILTRHCYECHGANPKKPERNFRVLDRASLLDPNRRNVVPGHADDSRLIQRIVDGTMPPKEKETELPRVSQLELSILRDWIAGGAARVPAGRPASTHPGCCPPIATRGRGEGDLHSSLLRVPSVEGCEGSEGRHHHPRSRPADHNTKSCGSR